VGTHIAKAEDLAEELSAEGPVEAVEEVGGELVVLAVPYTEAPHVVRQHADALADGRVIVDITNPIDLATLEPLELDGSAGEVIAAAAPEGAAVVKAFNTTFAGPLRAGQVAGRPLDVLIAGDDGEAKDKVRRLVEDGGLRPVDAGELRRARELEALGYLHMVVQQPLGTVLTSAVVFVTP
jgi:predicted dinucleotide-binding enzyme